MKSSVWVESVQSIPLGVRFVQVRSVHFRAPWASSGMCGCVRSIHVDPGGRRVHSGAFGPFLRALVFAGFNCVCSLHSRAPLGSSGSFGYGWSIPVRHCCVRVSSGAFGPLPHTIEVVVVVRVRSVHSRAPFWA